MDEAKLSGLGAGMWFKFTWGEVTPRRRLAGKKRKDVWVIDCASWKPRNSAGRRPFVRGRSSFGDDTRGDAGSRVTHALRGGCLGENRRKIDFFWCERGPNACRKTRRQLLSNFSCFRVAHFVISKCCQCILILVFQRSWSKHRNSSRHRPVFSQDVATRVCGATQLRLHCGICGETNTCAKSEITHRTGHPGPAWCGPSSCSPPVSRSGRWSGVLVWKPGTPGCQQALVSRKRNRTVRFWRGRWGPSAVSGPSTAGPSHCCAPSVAERVQTPVSSYNLRR